MRLGGIASGMDTEKMVKELMNAERMRVNKYYRQQETIKWKQEALNTTNKTLADFILKVRSGFGLTSTSSTGSILNKATDSFDWVKKVSSSNESIVKATATNGAMEGTYNIDVTQLASVASITSEDMNALLTNNRFNSKGSFSITTGKGTATINVADAKYEGTAVDLDKLDFSGDRVYAIYVSGELLELKEGMDLEEELTKFADKLKDKGVTLEYDEANKSITFTSKQDITIGASDDAALEALGLKSGVYTADNTMANIVKQINNAVAGDGKTNLGLRASYDSKLGKLMITTKEQGIEQFIKIEDTELAKSIFGEESVAIKGEEVDGVILEGARGRDAKLTLNGEEVKQTSNSFTMFGVNYQLQKTGSVSLNVETNVDSVVEKVKEFVLEYNTMIDFLNGLVNEKSYRDYTPLVSEEKEAMKEKEIELWESKAKSGLLRNDESIARLLQNMRSGLYESVYDTWNGTEKTKLSGFNHITQIGISTGDYRNGGKLEIDEEKLRQAIIDNPDGVIDLLFKKSSITNVKNADGKVDATKVTEKKATSGLIERIFNDMISGMQDIVRRSGTGDNASLYRSVQSNMLIDFVTSGSISVLDKDITSIGSRITREEQWLVSKETRYWNQFTAMEKAMQKMNSQSSWLSAQMGM